MALLITQPDETCPAAPHTPKETAAPAIQVMIAGSRYATRPMLDYARKVVRRAHAKGYTILVGDHPKGVDRAVVEECRRLRAKVIVAGISHRPRNGGCSHGSYIRVDRDTYRAMGGDWLNAYTARDRWMVDNATLGVFIWNGESRGTKQGHDYMVSRGKEAHLVTFVEGGRHG